MILQAPSSVRFAVTLALFATASALQAQPPSPATPRIQLSEKVSSAIAEGIKYQPAPAEAAPPKPPERPRNTIIRLPEHVVEAERPQPFTEREVHKPEDRLKLARRRYLGHFHQNVLSRYRIVAGDDAYALQRLADDERLAQMSHFDDQLHLMRISGNEAEARQLQREMRSMFVRHSGL